MDAAEKAISETIFVAILTSGMVSILLKFLGTTIVSPGSGYICLPNRFLSSGTASPLAFIT